MPDPRERHHEHMDGAGAPGASSPGEQGWSGEATIGDEGAAAGPESYVDPTGREDLTGGEGPAAGEVDQAGA